MESTLFDTAVGLLHPHAANWFVNGQVPALAGSGHPNVVPYDKFSTRSGEVFLGIGNDGQFRKFCEFVGAPELATDPRYASNGERNRNRDSLRASIEALLAGQDAAALCEALLKAGVPAGPVHQLPEVLEHPHTRHREMVVEFDNGQQGLGIPVKLSRTPGSVQAPAPAIGQHTRQVLGALGYSAAQVDELLKQGIARAD